MPILTIHKKQLFKVSIPYWVFINGHPIGIMKGNEVSVELPAAQFELGIKIIFGLYKWQFAIGGTRMVSLAEGQHLHLRITDKERWWNLLFDIDLFFWLAKLFFELPYPWDIVYEVISNGFFILWILRIWVIRNRYFQISDL